MEPFWACRSGHWCGASPLQASRVTMLGPTRLESHEPKRSCRSITALGLAEVCIVISRPSPRCSCAATLAATNAGESRRRRSTAARTDRHPPDSLRVLTGVEHRAVYKPVTVSRCWRSRGKYPRARPTVRSISMICMMELSSVHTASTVRATCGPLRCTVARAVRGCQQGCSTCSARPGAPARPR
jgi:hypothetical protein